MAEGYENVPQTIFEPLGNVVLTTNKNPLLGNVSSNCLVSNQEVFLEITVGYLSQTAPSETDYRIGILNSNVVDFPKSLASAMGYSGLTIGCIYIRTDGYIFTRIISGTMKKDYDLKIAIRWFR